MGVPISGKTFRVYRSKLRKRKWKIRIDSNQEHQERLFDEACAIDAHDKEKAVRLYQELLIINPRHAGAHVNLGNLFYNTNRFWQAKDQYLAAILAEPDFALAYFGLGNAWDVLRRYESAIGAYRFATILAPDYADAYYNLALVYDKIKEWRRALPHWQRYVRLDPDSSWGSYARSRIKQIIQDDPLKIVFRNQKGGPA